MVLDSKVEQYVPVVRVPDPTFLFEVQPIHVREILTSQGVDLNRPIPGILFYGKPEFTKSLCKFYHLKGFQTVVFSMYNPYADVNVGHLISSYEWADTFKYLTFCVTDRFHGTIFCLKNNIPFISIEPKTPENIKNSKSYSLICGFKMSDFIERGETLRDTWGKNYQLHISKKLNEVHSSSLDFIQQIKSILT